MSNHPTASTPKATTPGESEQVSSNGRISLFQSDCGSSNLPACSSNKEKRGKPDGPKLMVHMANDDQKNRPDRSFSKKNNVKGIAGDRARSER